MKFFYKIKRRKSIFAFSAPIVLTWEKDYFQS